MIAFRGYRAEFAQYINAALPIFVWGPIKNMALVSCGEIESLAVGTSGIISKYDLHDLYAFQ